MIGFENNDDYRRTSELLEAVGYTEAGLEQILGQGNILNLQANDIPAALRRARDLSPLGTLVRLFFMGRPVPAEAARRAVAPLSLEDWLVAGLVGPAKDKDNVAPLVHFWPCQGLMLAVDLRFADIDGAVRDMVMPPGLTSVQLAWSMIRRPAARALDLGTGSGLLALLAAAYSEQVVATDKNERAVEFANFNAKLNGIGNVRAAAGDLFDPVAGERFDLIVSNPPFVIAPAQRFVFRDSGLRGDRFCRELIRAVPAHLEPGGYCQLMCNLAHEAGRPWQESLDEWFEGTGCDVVVWVQRTDDVAQYAMDWILSTESHDVDEVPRLFDVWMDYFEKERIEGVSFLLVTMRRTDGGPTWRYVDHPPCHVVGPCSEEILRCFDVQDLLAAAGDPQSLLDRRLRLSREVRIEQQHAMTDQGLQPLQVRLQKTGGLQYPMNIDAQIASLVAQCDGRRTLGELLAGMAAAVEVDPQRVFQVALPVVRSLVERRVLLAEEGPPVNADQATT